MVMIILIMRALLVFRSGRERKCDHEARGQTRTTQDGPQTQVTGLRRYVYIKILAITDMRGFVRF